MIATFWLDGKELRLADVGEHLPQVGDRVWVRADYDELVVLERWFNLPGTYLGVGPGWHIVLRRPDTSIESTPPWKRAEDTAELEMLAAMLRDVDVPEQKVRAVTGMTLGKVIAALGAMGDTLVHGLGHLESYRGYYSDIAFEPTNAARPASVILVECRDALGRVFQGYKGGEYVMERDTPVWVAHWGECTDTRLAGFEVRDGVAYPVTFQDDT